MTHGLTAKNASRNKARKARENKTYRCICEDMGAVGIAERQLCREMARCWWRIKDADLALRREFDRTFEDCGL